MYCKNCGKELNNDSNFCPSCGTSINSDSKNFSIEKENSEQKQQRIHCPKCLSDQITDNPKGFSVGKAIGGAVLTGGIGLLAGFHGSSNTIITCLSCGHQFKPGEGIIADSAESYIKEIDNEIINILKTSSSLLEAVQVCTQKRSMPLVEAKKYVEDLASRENISLNSNKGGCAGVVAIIVIVGGSILTLVINSL